jgi:hypothetical protein
MTTSQAELDFRDKFVQTVMSWHLDLDGASVDIAVDGQGHGKTWTVTYSVNGAVVDQVVSDGPHWLDTVHAFMRRVLACHQRNNWPPS